MSVFEFFYLEEYHTLEQEKSMNEYERLATYDPLTRLYNRRKMYELLSDEIDRFECDPQPFSLALCDIDGFKAINDSHGFSVGDKVLVSVSRTLFRGTREDDHLGRTGGDEFMLLLPGISLKGAIEVAEKLRKRVVGHVPTFIEGDKRISVSVGVVEFSDACDFTSVLKHADHALRFAKQMGKNQVKGIYVS